MFDLTGKVALITGATGGIGGAIAKKMKEAGATVVVSGRNIAKMNAEFDDSYIKIPCDLSTDGGAVDLIMDTIEKAGKIDILVNNAGISQIKPFADITEDDWDEMIRVNLKGVYNSTKSVVDTMINQKSGKIINISSIWGQVGASCEVHYSTAKAGIIGFTKALSKELALSNIQVNCIAPGIIDTDMNSQFDREELKKEVPSETIGTPLDVAKAVLFLASDETGYITGQVLGVNGGIC